jgi:hypothetical protein
MTTDDERDLLREECAALLRTNATLIDLSRNLCDTVQLLLNQVHAQRLMLELYASVNPN